MSGGAVVAILVVCMTALKGGHAQDSPYDYLTPHNQARAAVGVGPLQWHPTLATYAEEHANKCVLEHSYGPYGENIFGGSSTSYYAADAVESWVAEGSYYDYSTDSCSSSSGCGHYTQVVWRNSLYLGCARAVCSNGHVFIVCSYHPPGNIQGEKPY